MTIYAAFVPCFAALRKEVIGAERGFPVRIHQNARGGFDESLCHYNLRSSGTPRIEQDEDRARVTIADIVERTAAYGLPPLDIEMNGTVAVVRPTGKD